MNRYSGILSRGLLAGLALVLVGACATYQQPRYGDEGVYYDDRYYPARSAAYINPVYYPYWSLDYFYFSHYYHPYSVLVFHHDPWFYPYPGWYYGYRPGVRFSLGFHFGSPFYYPWHPFGFHYHHFHPWRPIFVHHHHRRFVKDPVRRTDLRLRDLQRLDAAVARGEMPRRLSDRLRLHAQMTRAVGSPRQSVSGGMPRRDAGATPRRGAVDRSSRGSRAAGPAAQPPRSRGGGVRMRQQRPARPSRHDRHPQAAVGTEAMPHGGSRRPMRSAPALIPGDSRAETRSGSATPLRQHNAPGLGWRPESRPAPVTRAQPGQPARPARDAGPYSAKPWTGRAARAPTAHRSAPSPAGPPVRAAPGQRESGAGASRAPRAPARSFSPTSRSGSAPQRARGASRRGRSDGRGRGARERR